MAVPKRKQTPSRTGMRRAQNMKFSSKNIIEDKKVLQKIYDFNFRQLELSIREIGYGDQSINKKMKDYINLLHGMLSDIHFWDDLEKAKKHNIIEKHLNDYDDLNDIIDYFDKFNDNLSKNTLNYFSKSVFKH